MGLCDGPGAAYTGVCQAAVDGEGSVSLGSPQGAPHLVCLIASRPGAH